MAEKGNIVCLEGDWNDNLKHRSSILTALELIGVKQWHKDNL